MLIILEATMTPVRTHILLDTKDYLIIYHQTCQLVTSGETHARTILQLNWNRQKKGMRQPTELSA
eukprot:5889360-Amphidinium_carterae.1